MASASCRCPHWPNCDRVEIPKGQRSTVRCVTGEARAMHAEPELEGALFQVASQFNLLEMTGPS